jgi:hypothetical protein
VTTSPQIGHLSRNCPDKDTVPGNENNKLPGLPSYSMEMTLLEDDSDSGSHGVLKSMPVGSSRMPKLPLMKTSVKITRFGNLYASEVYLFDYV